MAKTKEIIVEKALRLFLEKGFYHVSMTMIAAEVGISKPAIYHHFTNKDELVEGVLDYFTARMKAWNIKYFKTSDSSQEILQKIFKAIPLYKNVEQVLFTEPLTEQRYSFNELLITLSKYKPEFKERIARDIRGGTQKIRQTIEQIDLRVDTDKSKLALFLHALIEGCTFLSEVRDDLDLQKMADDFYQIISLLLITKGEK